MFLEKAQKLDLEGEWNFTYFIQEKRSSHGHFETALALGVGTRERPLLMAEQLAFQERLRDGAAINGDEGAVLPHAFVVNGPGRHFLACSTFTEKQHRGVGRCHFADGIKYGADCRAGAHHPGEDVATHHLLHLPILHFETGHVQAASHEKFEFVRVHRFDQKIVGA